MDRGIYGGQMNNTAGIDNYPGFVDIQGPELGEKMYQTATNAGAEFVMAMYRVLYRMVVRRLLKLIQVNTKLVQ